LAAIVALSLPLSATAQNAFVRVNQVGYERQAPKRAYLMSTDAETGATFEVSNSRGRIAFSAPILANQDQGGWGQFAHVYALDFDSVTRRGTYTITVHGPDPAVSSSFRIEPADRIFSQPIANALSFYQNERDGSRFIPSPLRTAPGHLHDAQAKVYLTPKVNRDGNFKGDLTPTGVVINAEGGWWDAGDYLKFVETHTYVVALMLIGARDFPRQMGRHSESSDFTHEAKFGLDWLQNMWDDKNQVLYYQVGIGGGNGKTVSDHDIWRLPQDDDAFGGTDPAFRFIRNRPVFVNTAGATGAKVSPNLAGRFAADFALCFQTFQRSRPEYARKCLLAAEHVFALADTAPKGRLLTALPFGFYPETEWRDDMELGAVELFFALAHTDRDDLPTGLPKTDPNFYLGQAAHWANAFINGPNDATDTLNLFDVSGLAHFELFRALAEARHTGSLEVTQADLLADLKKQLGTAVTQAQSDPFGFGFPWDTFDTTTHGAGLVVMASEYDFLTGTKTFETFAHRWLANILGANAWGTSLIVGDGSVFPHCMQHQVANLVGSTDGTPPVLNGAAVEGPNNFAATGVVDGMITCPADGIDVFAPFNGDNINGNDAVYQDNVQSFSTVEPAIDLTASSPLAFAWLIAGHPAEMHRDEPED
jgi:endoglucanase